MHPKPAHPCPSNRLWQHEIIPKQEKLIDFYEIPDIFLGTLSKNLLIYASPVRPAIQVVAQRGPAPPNMKRQLDYARGLREVLRIDVVGHSHGPGIWT